MWRRVYIGFVDFPVLLVFVCWLCACLIPPSLVTVGMLTPPFCMKVIAHLIGLEMTGNPNITLKEATGKALARLVVTTG